MNPELHVPAPQIQPEHQPTGPDHSEDLPNLENRGKASHEREQNMQQVDRQTTPPPPPAAGPLPVPVPSLPMVNSQKTDDSTGPVLASDDDLIEKEWVDNAKKIIAETQNDPFRREKEVTKLQIDYLRKRYGKELGISN